MSTPLREGDLVWPSSRTSTAVDVATAGVAWSTSAQASAPSASTSTCGMADAVTLPARIAYLVDPRSTPRSPASPSRSGAPSTGWIRLAPTSGLPVLVDRGGAGRAHAHGALGPGRARTDRGRRPQRGRRTAAMAFGADATIDPESADWHRAGPGADERRRLRPRHRGVRPARGSRRRAGADRPGGADPRLRRRSPGRGHARSSRSRSMRRS